MSLPNVSYVTLSEMFSCRGGEIKKKTENLYSYVNSKGRLSELYSLKIHYVICDLKKYFQLPQQAQYTNQTKSNVSDRITYIFVEKR